LHGILETMQPLWGRPIEAIVRYPNGITSNPTDPEYPNDDAVTPCRQALAGSRGVPRLPNNLGKALQPPMHNNAGVALIGLGCLPRAAAPSPPRPSSSLQVHSFISI
jgi:hypothetical protein